VAALRGQSRLAQPSAICRASSAGGFSWIGLHALYMKEVRRFLVVWVQTIVGPVVATLLFVAVFAVALRARSPEIAGLTYLEFIAPGLIMMAMLQNAFANTSSSILIAKLNGTIADVLSAPLGPVELTAAYAFGALTRAVVVGIIVSLAMAPLGVLQATAPARILLFGLGGSLLFGLLGTVGGIWAEKMEHIAFMSSIVVAPLTILSGTFYALEQLPEGMRSVGLANPVFYLIDGFRAGFTGHAEASPAIGVGVVVAANLCLVGVCLRLFATGWRLKP
jgi:ABC-2 type transport system permease protein